MAHTIKEISDSLNIPFEGDGSIKIESISSAISAEPNQLVVAISKEYTADLANSNAKAALMFQGADWQSFGLRAALLPKQSKLKMSEIFNLYNKINETKIEINPMAMISTLRETSVLMGIIIGVLALKESFGKMRIIAAILVIGGLCMMNLIR